MTDETTTDPAECEFCTIVRREQQAEIVFEDEHCVAFFPDNPASLGHTLVIPKLHSESFLSLDESTASALARTVRTVARAIRSALEPEGMNVVTSAGAVATQTVFHTHIHVVPRWSDDDVGTFWPDPNPLIPDDVLGGALRAIRSELL